MSVAVTFAGNTYLVPEDSESGWEDLTDYLVALAQASVATTNNQAIRVASTSPITVSAASDFAVVCNVSGASAVTLPAGVKGQIFAIIDGSGAAEANPITISGTGGQTLAGAASFVLRANRGAVAFQFDGSQWQLLQESPSILRSTLFGLQPAANTSFLQAGTMAASAFPTPSNLQSCTAAFGGSTMIKFCVALSNGKAMECSTSFASNIINCLSDPDNLFLTTDSGSGIYPTKSAGSATVTIKNRTGGGLGIEIRSETNSLTSVTAWS